MISLGSMLPHLVSKWNLSEIQAGNLTALLPAGILAGSLFFGPVVDRFSYKYLLIGCAILIGLGLNGLASSVGLIYVHLGLFFAGFGGGAINGATNALVADLSMKDPQKRSANLSFLGVFFGIGAIMTPSLLGVLGEWFSRDTIISGIGSFVVIPSLFFASIRFPLPKQPQGFPLKTGLRMAGEIPLLLLGMILFFQSGWEGIISNWSTIFLEDIAGRSPDNALFSLSLFVLSLTLTRLVLVPLLKRVRPYQVLIGSLIVNYSGVLFFNLPIGSFSIYLALILVGIGSAAGFPVILSYVAELYSSLSGTAFSLVFVIALLGNILVNYTMGVISYLYGIEQYVKMLLAIQLFLTVFLIVALRNISTKIKV